MKKALEEFNTKLSMLISECSGYSYPEEENCQKPDYSKKVEINKSIIKKWKRQCEIKNMFKKHYDVEALKKSYNLFEDEYSKEMFLKVALYRVSKKPLLRFPLFYSNHYSKLSMFENLAIDQEQIRLWQDNMLLKKYDLSPIGYDIKLWFTTAGISIDFDIEQYSYKDIVKPEKSDNVLDCGGCYGDTALYFAAKTQGGNVYSFEFMPENVQIFNKNLELNPKYKNNIYLCKNPVSNETGIDVYFKSNGPGTSITTYLDEDMLKTTTISIDSFIENNKLEKIDFIKMDIEGSEAAALKGALNTIQKYKPKLAICAYHFDDDLITLPWLIKSILPEYKLYLDHNTISKNETVIYAKV